MVLATSMTISSTPLVTVLSILTLAATRVLRKGRHERASLLRAYISTIAASVPSTASRTENVLRTSEPLTSGSTSNVPFAIRANRADGNGTAIVLFFNDNNRIKTPCLTDCDHDPLPQRRYSVHGQLSVVVVKCATIEDAIYEVSLLIGWLSFQAYFSRWRRSCFSLPPRSTHTHTHTH